MAVHLNTTRICCYSLSTQTIRSKFKFGSVQGLQKNIWSHTMNFRIWCFVLSSKNITNTSHARASFFDLNFVKSKNSSNKEIKFLDFLPYIFLFKIVLLWQDQLYRNQIGLVILHRTPFVFLIIKKIVWNVKNYNIVDLLALLDNLIIMILAVFARCNFCGNIFLIVWIAKFWLLSYTN